MSQNQISAQGDMGLPSSCGSKSTAVSVAPWASRFHAIAPLPDIAGTRCHRIYFDKQFKRFQGLVADYPGAKKVLGLIRANGIEPDATCWVYCRDFANNREIANIETGEIMVISL